jgi:AbrB family looped-hinge helix DNA binding protein
MSLKIIKVVKIYGKGRIQVPSEVRKMLELRDGDRVCFMEDEQGQIVLVKAPLLKGQIRTKYSVRAEP